MNLKSINPSFIIYIVGVILLGLFYGEVKQSLGGKLLFFVCVVVYLLALRLIAELVSKKWK